MAMLWGSSEEQVTDGQVLGVVDAKPACHGFFHQKKKI